MGEIIDFEKLDGRNDGLKLKISRSDGHPGRVTNIEWAWGMLCKRLASPTKDELTLAQFVALPEAAQLRRKNNGYFVGAQFRGGIRKKILMEDRYLITFDADKATPGMLADLELGTTGLGDIEYCVYSTRKHSAAKPRIRIVIPLKSPLPPDQFQPVSRILAHRLDPSMNAVDRVSFSEAQFMYWPSVCAGEEFAYIHNRGPVLDPGAVLAEWGDWQDYARLPRCPTEREMHQGASSKPDPRSKRGIVGAFCRMYDIHDAIAKFLPGVYVPSERDGHGVPTRYTYTRGSTANGAVVYDDGMALHSHHGTDPCCDLNVNPFDLVRMHEYGHLDDPAEEAGAPQDAKSFVAFAKLLQEDPEIVRELRIGHYGSDDDLWDDMPAEGEADDPQTAAEVVEAATPEDWHDRLDTNTNGIVKSNLPNIALILTYAATFAGRFAYDEFYETEVQLKPIRSKSLELSVPGRSASDPVGRVREDAIAACRLILEAPRGTGKPGWGLRVADRDLVAAIMVVAGRNRVHPVREYLNSLVWDGVKRAERLWIAACHAADSRYHRATARLTLLGAVARTYEPGHKFDYAPIIEGPQGTGKSSLPRVLAGPAWAGETEGHFDNTARFVEAITGRWIVEIPELVQFGRTEVQAIKAALTRREDVVRLAYAKTVKTYRRRGILIGTTNEAEYLRDQTGNRRFWPIKCGPGQIDLAWLAEHRDQLWAEAVATYRAMREAQPEGDLPLYLTGEVEAAEAVTEQASRVVHDVAEEHAGMIEQWLNTPVPLSQARLGAEPGDAGDAFADEPLAVRNATCAQEIWEKVIGRGVAGEYSSQRAQTVGRAMRHIDGWHKTGAVSTHSRYGVQRTYRRTGHDGSEPTVLPDPAADL